MISPEEVRRRLDYDPLTGVFLWRETECHRSPVGSIAGGLCRSGYRYILIGGKRRLAHRLAWLASNNEWPEHDIDHIDGNRDNNALANLRPATRSQNLANSRMKSHNTSGFKGVSFHKARGRWRARITFNYREILVGHFDSPETASRAYEAKAKQLFGEFARA